MITPWYMPRIYSVFPEPASYGKEKPLCKKKIPLQYRRREHLEHLCQHRKDSRGGISGYILAKRVYPKPMEEGVESFCVSQGPNETFPSCRP